jgi:hypothetical protein
MQPSQSSFSNPAAAHFIKYDFPSNYCQGCLKIETSTRFNLCGRCKHIRYCTGECQKADWIRHKQFCPEQVDKELNYADTERKQYREKLAGKILTKMLRFQVNLQNKAQVIQRLSVEGDMYRKTLFETSISSYIELQRAKLRGDIDQARRLKRVFHDNLDMYVTVFIPEMLARYPLKQEMDKKQNYLLEVSHDIGQFLPRVERSSKKVIPQTTKNTVQMAKELYELGASAGSLFLNKGYPDSVHAALQDLRKICIDTVAELISIAEMKKANDFLMLWVYEKVCTSACIGPDSYERFILGVKNRDCTLLLGSLNYESILEHVLKNYKAFDALKLTFTQSHLQDVCSSISSGTLNFDDIKNRADRDLFILYGKGRLPEKKIVEIVENLERKCKPHNDVEGFGKYFTALVCYTFCNTISPNVLKLRFSVENGQ